MIFPIQLLTIFLIGQGSLHFIILKDTHRYRLRTIPRYKVNSAKTLTCPIFITIAYA